MTSSNCRPLRSLCGIVEIPLKLKISLQNSLHEALKVLNVLNKENLLIGLLTGTVSGEDLIAQLRRDELFSD